MKTGESQKPQPVGLRHDNLATPPGGGSGGGGPGAGWGGGSSDPGRVYLCKSNGFRFVRGGPVLDIQRALAPISSTPLDLDGVYGGQCETAVRLWQTANGLPATGMVDDLTWRGITASEPPSLFRRCLALTAAFEGHGYTLVAGNFDNAYVTWGIVGFTLKHGNLGKVIERVNTRHPGLLDLTIGGAMADRLRTVIKGSAADKRAFGDEISIPPKKYRCNAAWTDAFEALGNRPEVRAVQDEVVREVYWAKAVADLKTFGEMTEADAALFFDTAVQNGGVSAAKGKLIKDKLAASPGALERERLALIADAIAEGSNPKYAEDVRSRRKTIALGEGEVHGARYRLEHWAIDYLPVTGTALV